MLWSGGLVGVFGWLVGSLVGVVLGFCLLCVVRVVFCVCCVWFNCMVGLGLL